MYHFPIQMYVCKYPFPADATIWHYNMWVVISYHSAALVNNLSPILITCNTNHDLCCHLATNKQSLRAQLPNTEHLLEHGDPWKRTLNPSQTEKPEGCKTSDNMNIQGNRWNRCLLDHNTDALLISWPWRPNFTPTPSLLPQHWRSPDLMTFTHQVNPTDPELETTTLALSWTHELRPAVLPQFRA